LGKIPVLRTSSVLQAELRAEADRMQDRPGRDFVDEVGLVERIVAVGRVLVRGTIESRTRGVDGSRQRAVAGIDVLVELLVVGEQR
jgi:hypothetical protein